MKQTNSNFRLGMPWCGWITALVVGWLGTGATGAQTLYPSVAGQMMLVESAAATRVVEQVRAKAPGVMVEILVKVGDPVKKDQILGHTDLDTTQLQFDMAKHALEAKGNLEAASGQAEAWAVTREETEAAVRHRKVDETRLEWARAMEKMYRGTYEMQVEAEKAQTIQYAYWKDQYDKRFMRAPVDGVVTEVVTEIGKPVNYATHVFTIGNDTTYAVPVTVSATLAEAARPNQTLPVRAADGKSSARALVKNVMDDPRGTGRKIINLLVRAADFPAAIRGNLKGMKFDVLLPQVAQESRRWTDASGGPVK